MAGGRGLIVAGVLLAGRLAAAADPCEELRLFTGVAVRAEAGGLAVAAVDDDSPAAASGLRAGDRIAQANATVPTDCAEWARAVRDARRERKALLLLVRRAETEVPLVLAQGTWERSVAVAPTAPPPTTPPPAPARQPAAAPSVAAIVREPLPAPAGTAAAEVIRALEALEPKETLRARVDSYRQGLLRVHRQIESLAAREAAPPAVVTALRTVARYFDAAEVAWTAEEDLREREDRPRHIPLGEAAAAPYFAHSDAEAVIFEFPFLRETVVREPGTGLLEVSGLWRPVQARTLLWERGREELRRVAQWVRAAD